MTLHNAKVARKVWVGLLLLTAVPKQVSTGAVKVPLQR